MALTLTDIYNKLTWKNSPDHTTPVNADNLNHIETGIKNNNTGLRAAETVINQNTSDIATNTSNIAQINTNLTANQQPFKFGYDSTSQQYGYIIESGGADTFFPFSSKAKYILAVVPSVPNAASDTLYIHCWCDTGASGFASYANTAYGTNFENDYVKVHCDAWNDKRVDFKKNCIQYRDGTIVEKLAGTQSDNVSYMGLNKATIWVFY